VEPFKGNLGNTWLSGDNVENTSIVLVITRIIGNLILVLKESESSSLEVREEISGTLDLALKEPVYIDNT